MVKKSFITKEAENHLPSFTNSVGTMLALSGGGVKGIMQLEMLAEMESQMGIPVSKMFQTSTGTSVGGLIAVLLAIPKEPGSTEPRFSAAEALELFENTTTDIFPQHWYHVGKMGQIFSHKYSQKPLKALLDKYLGDMKLEDLLGRVLITTFDLNAKESIKIFDSHNAPGVKAKDVILATTAAPSYFKSVKLDDENGVSRVLVDGGVGYNRPAAEAIKYLKSGLNRDQQRELLDDMTLVALNFKSPNEKKDPLPPHLDGLLPQMVNGLVGDIMKAAQDAATAEVKRDLAEDGQFTEFLLPVPKGSTKLDNSKPANMAKLKKAAEKYVEDNKELIEKLCTTLVKNVQAREESLKLHDAQSVEESSVLSEDKKSDNIDKKGQDKDTVNTHVISEEFEAKLAINLTEKQAESLKEGLMKLSPKEYDVLQVFLKGLNDTQLEALSAHLPLIADGNFKNINISELSHFQNKFLKFFSSMFEHEDNIINEAISCVQEYHNEEIACDGRGSEVAHYVDMVY
ncbi:patatin-like phospholipase family protein [Rickettsia endosymbiont of Oedothorax gibbosus]|uniref:patatin-like phospholipase family protein n=1 Tax=Rickettsia endosymbiont of Oedothorax gibbosus TaxID=931099 RepID=UPI002023BE84|nr:patatin-like phospholipase family protein [Rickettsia endosymbiont of Oedothorax gibbosus]